jgi:HAD superfamily hydrolase (TIGR01549 family)
MIIFDLDQTLIDSSSVEPFRRARNWSEVMRRLDELKEYEGITPLLGDLAKYRKPMAIVTKSPDMIAKAIVKKCKWPIQIIIGYHQVKARKPAPDGLLLAMQKSAAKPHDTFHIGDQADDTAASRGANVIAIGAAWGISDAAALKTSRPDHLFSSVKELQDFLLSVLIA